MHLPSAITMLALLLFSAAIAPASSFSSFSPLPGGAGAAGTLVDLSPLAGRNRDVFSMAEWAASCGVQQAEGVQLTSYDGIDYFPATQSDIPAGSPVMYCPSDLIMSSTKAAQEFGAILSQCENKLVAEGGTTPSPSSRGMPVRLRKRAPLQDQIQLFRLFFKVLAEYEKGDQSPWFPWLNSLPREFYTGASMTHECFDCLPPYAGYCALAERTNSVNFMKAVGRAAPRSEAVPFGPDIVNDSDVLNWAYNIAQTRSFEVNGELIIAPMIDMFNHGAAAEVELQFDGSDCYAYSTVDVPAGSPLRVSYGDPTDPTPLFAKYGFLDEESMGTFCKLMHMLKEMEELGYTFSNLLFYRNGDISPEVYDVVLYHVLKKSGDPNTANAFYQAVMGGDEATKAQYQEQYWQYTKEELQSHVNGLLADLDKWSQKASSYDLNTHPRVPLILQHNQFVKETFLQVKANLDIM